jgi:hypothetical protein
LEQRRKDFCRDFELKKRIWRDLENFCGDICRNFFELKLAKKKQ